MRLIVRIALVIVFVAAAAATIVIHRADRSLRREALAFARAYTFDVRRPEVVAAVRYSPHVSEAIERISDAAARDALGGVRLETLDDAERQAWLEAVGRVDDELRDARKLTPHGIRLRPAWAYQHSVLGMLEYATARRAGLARESADRWFLPLRTARALAPGDRSLAIFAAGPALDAWPALDAAQRKEAIAFFGAALHDPRFASVYYGPLSDVIGFDEAMRILPDEPRSIAAAVRAHAEVGDAGNAARLDARWVAAERARRAKDLAAVEERARLHDVLGLRRECRAWLTRHSVFDFDDATGRREAGRVLELWPPEKGNWRSDPRAAAVTFFVEREGEGVPPAALARAARSLDEIPLPTLARAELLGGDAYSATSLADKAASAGGFEWTPFYVDLAQHHLERQQLDDAGEAVRQIAAAAREECDVVVVRQAIESARGRTAAPSPGTFLREYPAAMWSRNRVPVCIDRASQFDVTVEASSAAFVTWSVDGARGGSSALEPGTRTIAVPLERAGRQVIGVDVIGGTVRVTGGRVR